MAELTALLDGAVDCVKAGGFSSLQPANVRLRGTIRNPKAYLDDPRYKLLFDPQTAGGLLASVPGEQADACITALRSAGYESACVIGRVLPQSDVLELVVLLG